MDFYRSLLNETYFNNTISQYLFFFVCIVIGIISGKIVYYIFKGQLRKLATKSETKLDDYLIDIFEEPIFLLLIAMGVWVGKFCLTLNILAEKFFGNIIFVLFSMTVTWLVIRLIDMLVKHYIDPLVAKSESKLDDQILPIISKSTKTIVSIQGVNPNNLTIRSVNFGPFSLDVEIVYWITDMANWKSITHEVNMSVKRNLDNAGIEMAFPTETHYVINQNSS
ncbi:MAG: hypothetical protein B6244_10195 [Candidatus Cloacimonetes bacterium 4572_55]|nr:MAG: hypothetical protein B6244_10195 [Candidatus Cloacimonetes bacterium 4572_55]